MVSWVYACAEGDGEVRTMVWCLGESWNQSETRWWDTPRRSMKDGGFRGYRFAMASFNMLARQIERAERDGKLQSLVGREAGRWQMVGCRTGD